MNFWTNRRKGPATQALELTFALLRFALWLVVACVVAWLAGYAAGRLLG